MGNISQLDVAVTFSVSFQLNVDHLSIHRSMLLTLKMLDATNSFGSRANKILHDLIENSEEQI